MTRLGELLVDENLVSQEMIDQALKIQVGGNRRLGHILVQMGAISDDQLAETLANQLNIKICDISTAYSSEVSKTVPRYLCQQYGILPLRLKENNILEVAMANPSDDEAITDLEHYTGKAIEPSLARQSEIDREIPKNIPFGVKDFFSPRSNIRFTRIGVGICLLLVMLVGSFTYKYIHDATYGSISVTSDSTIYKNHDLMLGFDNNGKINLLGHGSFAKGYYSATFNNVDILHSFLQSRKSDLSEKQKSWLDWVISKEHNQPYTESLAAAD